MEKLLKDIIAVIPEEKAHKVRAFAEYFVFMAWRYARNMQSVQIK
jgi:hypothetical protein